MERDFMGLNSKDSVVVVKEEDIEGRQEPDGFEPFNNHHSAQIQKSIGYYKPSGNHFLTVASCVPRAPVQLTIFYGGMVNVYDDISPEKAQAILLLAGKGARAQPQVRTPRTPSGDMVYVSQPMSTPPGSIPGAAKDAPRGMGSLGHVMQSAVPQARKASLARFLEKRKERVMASAPYSLGKSSLDSTGNVMFTGILRKDVEITKAL